MYEQCYNGNNQVWIKSLRKRHIKQKYFISDLYLVNLHNFDGSPLIEAPFFQFVRHTKHSFKFSSSSFANVNKVVITSRELSAESWLKYRPMKIEKFVKKFNLSNDNLFYGFAAKIFISLCGFFYLWKKLKIYRYNGYSTLIVYCVFV